MDILGSLVGLWEESGFYSLIVGFTSGGWQNIVMIAIACLLLFLGISKQFEPLLLVGIAFGMLLTNLPNSAVYTPELWVGAEATANSAVYTPELWVGAEATANVVDYGEVLRHGGLIDVLYIGVKTGLYPSLIFIGVGAMTDFGPMLARPSSLLLGAAAQLGIFVAFIGAMTLCGFDAKVAASIGIIGGADGPTAIWLTKTLAPEYLGSIAIAAYSYMALIPLIQPPIIRLLTTKKERLIRMDNTRQVSKTAKIVFPIVVTIVIVLVLPSVAGLLGCLMFGNLLKECGVTDRLSDTAQNALMNIVTLFLGISVGATATAANFLKPDTLMIVAMGLVAFCFSTAGGVLFGKLMCALSKGKINPMIGAAGVSAVPMAARVVHNEGRRYDLDNHLLMHAMAPNVAGVIGSSVVAGLFMSLFG